MRHHLYRDFTPSWRRPPRWRMWRVVMLVITLQLTLAAGIMYATTVIMRQIGDGRIW